MQAHSQTHTCNYFFLTETVEQVLKHQNDFHRKYVSKPLSRKMAATAKRLAESAAADAIKATHIRKVPITPENPYPTPSLVFIPLHVFEGINIEEFDGCT